MDIAGAWKKAARTARALRRRRRTGLAMRELTDRLADALRARPRPPAGVRELCRALCEEMAARQGGRPVELRFERFPDELDVTGLWVELRDFDLIIVEERAEAVQQLVILGHELWHLHAGHGHRPGARTAGVRALAEEIGKRDTTLCPGLSAALERGGAPVAARNGSRERDEAEADDFGHRLATLVRPYLDGHGSGPPPGPVQRSLGYLGKSRGRQ
ncbi:toxin-antitoxin system, toxin component family protein [Streptomyces poonensis]|uniref:Toxin-antitoxin system, toxin component family protein n=1 Tax=Streptomyces poonensis TaxID=68255 RepID=A0A918PJ04_9ACTN|nr:toxin-antitoxin system, toxin component family protein [Streptomyces poonensis]GGZ11751.1 hypothetical protein GCM10010365_34270 [Streptomyces poonensis]GLJ92658.1 hypothetical protein GCM10017589_52680 [Streptomyces poonensis]